LLVGWLLVYLLLGLAAPAVVVDWSAPAARRCAPPGWSCDPAYGRA
jgi:hypothetical protein